MQPNTVEVQPLLLYFLSPCLAYIGSENQNLTQNPVFSDLESRFSSDLESRGFPQIFRRIFHRFSTNKNRPGSARSRRTPFLTTCQRSFGLDKFSENRLPASADTLDREVSSLESETSEARCSRNEDRSSTWLTI